MNNIIIEYCSYYEIKKYLPVYWDFSTRHTNLLCIHSVCEGRLLGVLIAEVADNSIIIRLLYVLPEFRRRKIGTKMWRLLLKEQGLQYQNYLLSFICFCSKSYLQCFIENLGFVFNEVDSSGIIINVSSWIYLVLPKISQFTSSVSCIYKLSGELLDDERTIIINTLKEEKVPDFLNPLRVYKDEKYEDKICFFQNDGNLLGWCISSLINAGTIDLRCTYVLKRYRNNKYVFAFWKIMTFHIKRKYPNIERLIFYYDNKCKSLEAFYKRIFEGSNYKPFYRLNYKLLLSGKSF